MPGPLYGIKVLDFTWALAGPYGVMILADMGAEIVRLDRVSQAGTPGAVRLPTGGRMLRRHPGPPARDENPTPTDKIVHRRARRRMAAPSRCDRRFGRPVASRADRGTSR